MDHLPLVEYLQSLIALRKEHPAFRMTSAEQIRLYLHFEPTPESCIAYTLNGAAMHDSWGKIYIAFNGSGIPAALPLPPGDWKESPLTGGPEATTRSGALEIPAYSAAILYR